MADKYIVTTPAVEGIPTAKFWIDETFRYYYNEDPLRISAAELYVTPNKDSDLTGLEDVPKFIESPNLIFNNSCGRIHLSPQKVQKNIYLNTYSSDVFGCSVLDTGIFTDINLSPAVYITSNKVKAVINNTTYEQTVWQQQSHAGAYNFIQMINTGNAIKEGSLPQVIIQNKVLGDTSSMTSVQKKKATDTVNDLSGGVFKNTLLDVNASITSTILGDTPSKSASSNYPDFIYLPKSFVVSSHLFSSPPDIEQSLANKPHGAACTYILINLFLVKDRKAHFVVETDIRGNMNFFLKENEHASKIPEGFSLESGRTEQIEAISTNNIFKLGYKKIGSVRMHNQSSPTSGKGFTDVVFFFSPFGLGIYQGVPQETSWEADWTYTFPTPENTKDKTSKKLENLFSARVQSVILGVKFASASFSMSDIVYPKGGSLLYGPVDSDVYQYTHSSTQDNRANVSLSTPVTNSSITVGSTTPIDVSVIPIGTKYNIKLLINTVDSDSYFTSFFGRTEWNKVVVSISPKIPDVLKGTINNPLCPISLSGSENVSGRSYDLKFFVPPKAINGEGVDMAPPSWTLLREQLQAIQGAYPCVLEFGYTKRQQPDEAVGDLGYMDTRSYEWINPDGNKKIYGFIWSSPKWSRTSKETTLSFTMVDRSEMLKQQWKACLPVYDGWRARDAIIDLCMRGGFQISDIDVTLTAGYVSDWSDQLSFGSLQGPNYLFPQTNSLWQSIETIAKERGFWVFAKDDGKIHVIDRDVLFGQVGGADKKLVSDAKDLLTKSSTDSTSADYVERELGRETDPKKIIWGITTETSFDAVYNQVILIGASPASYYIGMELKNPALQVLHDSIPKTAFELQSFISLGTYAVDPKDTAVNIIPFPKIYLETNPRWNSKARLSEFVRKYFYRFSTRYEGLSFSCRGYTDRSILDIIIIMVASEPRVLPNILGNNMLSVDSYLIESINYDMSGSDKTFNRSFSCSKIDLDHLQFLKDTFDTVVPNPGTDV